MKSWLNYFTDPVTLSGKEKIIAIAVCFFSILTVSVLTQSLVGMGSYPVLVASMGASAVILFIIPSSPLAQPWPFVGGQLISAWIGVTSTQVVAEIPWAAALAAGGSVLVMLLLRCLHPPGSATALAPVLAGDSITSLGYDFVLFPVAVNVMFMFLLAIVINRWLLKRDYPAYNTLNSDPSEQAPFFDRMEVDISDVDLNDALNKSDTFVDVTAVEIKKLLIQVKQQRFKRIQGEMTCSDIMDDHAPSVEYDTQIEDAWEMLYRGEYDVLPVIDRSQRVIGIVTKSDFFKFINLLPYEKLQDEIRSFIRRSFNLETDKPEFVGHIMTKNAVVRYKNDHIVELIPLMTTLKLRHVPIIDEEKRLIGMVHQPQLIAALYHQKQIVG